MKVNFVFRIQFVVLPINLFHVEFSNIHYFSNLVSTTNLISETNKHAAHSTLRFTLLLSPTIFLTTPYPSTHTPHIQYICNIKLQAQGFSITEHFIEHLLLAFPWVPFVRICRHLYLDSKDCYSVVDAQFRGPRHCLSREILDNSAEGISLPYLSCCMDKNRSAIESCKCFRCKYRSGYCWDVLES